MKKLIYSVEYVKNGRYYKTTKLSFDQACEFIIDNQLIEKSRGGKLLKEGEACLLWSNKDKLNYRRKGE